MNRIPIFVALVAALPACASVPSHFSARSAASAESVPAPTADIGRALREDPPLPGAGTEGWAGLAPPSGGDDSMAHMHHHAGMHMDGMGDMSGMDMSGMDMSGMSGMDAGVDGGVPSSMEGMHHAH
jgi:hypothetical protein